MHSGLGHWFRVKKHGSYKMKLEIYTDGGSRGNPGPGGLGVVVYDQATKQEIHTQSAFLGRVTNNEAEYQGMISSLEWLKDYAVKNPQKVKEVTWYLDSKLVVEQLNKRWKIKDPKIKLLAQKSFELLKIFSLPISEHHLTINIKHVRREKNKVADALANQAMDLASK